MVEDRRHVDRPAGDGEREQAVGGDDVGGRCDGPREQAVAREAGGARRARVAPATSLSIRRLGEVTTGALLRVLGCVERAACSQAKSIMTVTSSSTSATTAAAAMRQREPYAVLTVVISLHSVCGWRSGNLYCFLLNSRHIMKK